MYNLTHAKVRSIGIKTKTEPAGGEAVTESRRERCTGLPIARCCNPNGWLLTLKPHLVLWAEADKATCGQKLLWVLLRTAVARRNRLRASARPPGRETRSRGREREGD